MSKQEALDALANGAKVTHRLFSENEWMIRKGNILEFEDGCQLFINEFYHIRKGPNWETGYSIISK